MSVTSVLNGVVLRTADSAVRNTTPLRTLVRTIGQISKLTVSYQGFPQTTLCVK